MIVDSQLADSLGFKQRFIDLCQRIEITGQDALRIFDEIVAQYSEAHRSYHNLIHIDRMLAWLDAVGHASNEIELAIWFHDVIYNPQESKNERKSARYFSNQFRAIIDSSLTHEVERLILATDPTQSRSGKDDEDLIIDIDLSILGSAPEDYETYRLAIRSEYSFVSENDFIAGRRSILEKFLAQPVYATPFFAQLEQQARVNITHELAELR